MFWDSLCEEVKKKIQNFESLRDLDSDPLDFLLQRETKTLSQYYKNLVSSLSAQNNTVASSSKPIPLVLSSSSVASSVLSSNQKPIVIMANGFAPLVLPTNFASFTPKVCTKAKTVWSRRRHHSTTTP